MHCHAHRFASVSYHTAADLHSITGSPCLYLYKRHCISPKSTLPISITELCRNLCHREPVTHMEVIKTGAIRLPFNFSVIKFFCLNCHKCWNSSGTRCNYDKWSPIKLFSLPKITKQHLTFQTRLQASIFQYWLTASQPPLLPMRTIHPLLLAKKISFTYPKTQVARLCYKPLEDISLKIGYHNKERHQIDLHVRAVRSRAAGARHRRKRICKSRLLNWKHWPSTEGGTHGPRPQNWCNFFRFVLRSVFETKVIAYPKRK